MTNITPIKWENDSVIMLDQSFLPKQLINHTFTNYRDVLNAVNDLSINGNSILGIASAMGLALFVTALKESDNIEEKKEEIRKIMSQFERTRPSHISIRNTMLKIKSLVDKANDIKSLKYSIRNESKNIFHIDMESNKRISDNGNPLIDDNDSILVFSNYGRFSAAGYGSVFGMLRKAKSEKKNLKIYIAETRPHFLGSRLTAWEMLNEKFDSKIITDLSALNLITEKKISKIILGTIGTFQNGDCIVENGVSSVAILAEASQVPVIVSSNSFFNFSKDESIGENFIFEERPIGEIAYSGDNLIVPEGSSIKNKIFETLTADKISMIVSDKGVERNVAENGIKNLQ